MESKKNVETPRKKSDANIRPTEHKAKSNYCKVFVRIVFSHVGMIVLVLIYIVAGAFLFQLLEQHSMIQRCQEGQGYFAGKHLKLRTFIFNYLWLNRSVYDDPYTLNSSENVPKSYEYFNRTQSFERKFNTDMDIKLKEYVSEIYSVTKKREYSVSDNAVRIENENACVNDRRWYIWSAFLFSLTMCSTIGYGHVTPYTWEGQIVCVCFAMIGIPMFCLSVANISTTLSDLFRTGFFETMQFLKRKFFKQHHQHQSETKSKTSKLKNPTDKISPFEQSGIINTNIGAAFITTNESKKQEIIDDYDEDEEEEDIEETKIKARVPLWIAIGILALYNAIGALIFNRTEADWDKTQAAYFSFITMATIGFGDIVPGVNDLVSSKETVDDSKSIVSLLITFLYAFFGIAILAFCIDLIQEEILIKFTSTRNLFASKVKVSRNVILNQKHNNQIIEKIEYDYQIEEEINNKNALTSAAYSRKERGVKSRTNTVTDIDC